MVLRHLWFVDVGLWSGRSDSDVSGSVYLQHHLAVVHVRLPEPQLQQLHIPNLSECTVKEKQNQKTDKPLLLHDIYANGKQVW